MVPEEKKNPLLLEYHCGRQQSTMQCQAFKNAEDYTTIQMTTIPKIQCLCTEFSRFVDKDLNQNLIYMQNKYPMVWTLHKNSLRDYIHKVPSLNWLGLLNKAVIYFALMNSVFREFIGFNGWKF